MLKTDILQPSASFQPYFSAPILKMYIYKITHSLIINNLQNQNVHHGFLEVKYKPSNFASSN